MTQRTRQWTDDAQYFEYSKAANPLGAGLITKVPEATFPGTLHGPGPSRIVPFDLSAELGVPDSKEVSVLFADIVGFTTMSEKMSPAAVSYLLNDYLSRNPKSQEAWYLLGKTYLQMSEDALGKINEIDPDSVVAHEIAGEIDESMHNYDLALVEYKKAIDKAPQTPGTHMHMGDAFWHMGKWQSAQTEFRAELLNDPNSGAPGADTYFSSKGHDAPALYSLLIALEKLDFDLIHRLRRLGGLPGHPDPAGRDLRGP